MHSDKNAAEIVKALRDAGVRVEYIEGPFGRGGIPDLLVGAHGEWLLMEIKEGKNKLSDKQAQWHARPHQGGAIVTVWGSGDYARRRRLGRKGFNGVGTTSCLWPENLHRVQADQPA